MKNSYFALASLLAILAFIEPAHALSTDQGKYQNTDGTPKFSDPDEQMPGFMVSPGASTSQNGSLSVNSFGNSSVNMPSAQDTSSGARAFDQAYDHQQNRE